MGVPVSGAFGLDLLKDARDFRYRCSIWIQYNGLSIVVDTGPEFRLQTIRAGIKHIDLLLFTHEHNDHVIGLDDLRPYNHMQKGPIHALASESCMQSIKRRFYYMFEPEKTPGSVDLEFVSEAWIKEKYPTLDLEILPVDHTYTNVWGYRIGDFSYVTDAKRIPDYTMHKLEGSKILVLNALRWSPPHPTHFTIPEAVEIAERVGAEKTYLIHMNSYVTHAETEHKLPNNIHLAYDTLELEL